MSISKGCNWTEKLFFDPEADEQEYKFPDDKIHDELKKNFSIKKAINEVLLIAVDHTKWWRFDQNFRDFKHYFVVFSLLGTNDDKEWWTLEKDDRGILIQRTQQEQDAMAYKRGLERPSDPEQIAISNPSADGNFQEETWADFLLWLQGNTGNLRNMDCHNFALTVFDHVTHSHTCTEINKPAYVCQGKQMEEGDDVFYAYFDPNAGDRGALCKYWFTSKELIESIEQLVDINERIESVVSYKKPLFEWQLTNSLLFHRLIVFKTRNGSYWSIEKNGEGLTIQRSKKLEAVRENYRQAPRLETTSHLKITEEARSKGIKTIKDLITWLKDENWLSCEYHLLARNCQTFAIEAYEFLTDKRDESFFQNLDRKFRRKLRFL